MDLDEEAATGAARACKRQKRTGSLDEDDSTAASGDGAAPAAGETKLQQQIKSGEETTTLKTTGKNGNNNGANVLTCAGLAPAMDSIDSNADGVGIGEQQQPLPEVENCVGANHEAWRSMLITPACTLDSDDDTVSEAEADEAKALLNNINKQPDIFGATINTDNSNDNIPSPTANNTNPTIEEEPPPSNWRSVFPTPSDDEPVSGSSANGTSASFNHRNIPPTRSYRRVEIISLSSSADSSVGAASESGRASATSETDEADAEAEAELESTANESITFSADDESSSGSSRGFILPQFLADDNNSSSDSDTIDDEGFDYNEGGATDADREQIECSVTEVLEKPKPSYGWNCTVELMQREHNISNRIGWRGGYSGGQLSFTQGFYGSRQAVERMKLTSTLRRHRSCVNSLNFNRAGDLICSGSDDLFVHVWDWANERVRHSFKSGHTLNIFQTKFIDSAGCLDIVSSSRDGQVRRAVIPPSGGATNPTRLYSHTDAVHKIVVVPHTRHEIMSAGEDATVRHFDLRTSSSSTTVLRCLSGRNRDRVRLFSIAHHPYAAEFCVSGSDDKLRVYDKRKTDKAVHEMTPKALAQNKITQITCAVYNHSGSEILASYSDAGVYLYDSRNYKDGESLHCYEGHINSRTIKGVNFFGPRSEYIVSGSDCGHIFFWDKGTEAVLNFVMGDARGEHPGVVNCLEPHPWMPVLATSGLEHNVKIWTPSSETLAPNLANLEDRLRRNFRRNILDTGDFDINQFHYFIRQFLQSNPANLRRMRRDRHRAVVNAQVDLEPNSNSSATSNSASSRHSNASDNGNGSHSDDDGADAALERLNCRTQ